LRENKEIKLSPQACEALGIETGAKLTGDELIRAILKAPVDLLWNGGIGTYVMGENETNLLVGDPSNDSVRIKSSELRAKIVSEGGNLGLTQQSRVEFSKSGGFINTDAVDNSAGVDLSDHEVNFKILLAKPLSQGRITSEQRNELLEESADLFCEKVLLHNKAQNLAITLATQRSRRDLSLYSQLIDFFEADLNLDRDGETLPSKEVLETRQKLQAGLTRPESAVVLAYSKMWVYQEALESDLAEKELLNPLLFSRFPVHLHERFGSDILNHQLKAEVVASSLANRIVDLMGAGFLLKVSQETSRAPLDVIKAFVLAYRLWPEEGLYEMLFPMQNASNLQASLVSIETVSDFLRSYVTWILTQGIPLDDLEGAMKELKQPNQTLKDFCQAGFKEQSEFKDLMFSSAERKFVGAPDEIKDLCFSSLRAKEVLACLPRDSSTQPSLSQSYFLYKSLIKRCGLKVVFDSLNNLGEEEPDEKRAKETLYGNMRETLKLASDRLSKNIGASSKGIIGKPLCKEFLTSSNTELQKIEDTLTAGRSESKKIGRKQVSAGKLFLFARDLESRLSQ